MIRLKIRSQMWILIAINLLQVSPNQDVESIQEADDIGSHLQWYEFNSQLYLFVYDINRDVDLSWYDAYLACKRLDSELVGIDSSEELTFIRERIELLVRSQGQQFGHEQWWTGGSRANSESQWEWRDGSEVDLDEAIQEHDEHWQHVHVSVTHDRHGWKMKALPGNYKLRYICEKVAPANPAAYHLATERLLAHLLGTYVSDTQSIHNRPLPIQMDVRPTTFIADNNGRATTSLLVSMWWIDSRLSWNPEQYDGVNSLSIEVDKIWKPPLVFLNGHTKEVYSRDTATARISPDGGATIQTVVSVTSQCHAHVYHYPYYSYTCGVQLLFPGFTNHDLNVTFTPTVGTATSMGLSCWSISPIPSQSRSTSRQPDISDYPYYPTKEAEKRFEFSASYTCGTGIAALIGPVLALYLGTLILFWIPRVIPIRAILGGCVTLAYIAFLLVVVWNRPQNVHQVSLLEISVYTGIGISCFSLVLSLLIIKMSQINERPLPGWACNILTKYTTAFETTLVSQYGPPPDVRDFSLSKNSSYVGCDITMGHTTNHGPPPPEVCSTLLATPGNTCTTRLSIGDQGQIVMFRPLWTHLARLTDRLCFVFVFVVQVIVGLTFVIVSQVSTIK